MQRTKNDLVPESGDMDPTDPAGGFDLLVAQEDPERIAGQTVFGCPEHSTRNL
jgi:hypothetical protein